MSLLLAIDTSAQQCRVGLAEDGVPLAEATGDSSRRAAQEVLPLIEDLLTGQNLSLEEIDFLAVVSGPGSFTGLRIGVAVAQALSYTQNIPVVPIPSMALLAWSAQKQHGMNSWLVFETAREPEVYFGCYRCDSIEGALLQGQEQVAPPAELRLPALSESEAVTSGEWGMVGSACSEIAKELKLPSVIQRYPDLIPRIEDLCELAMKYFQAGSFENQLVLPNYVKEQMDYS